MATTPATKPATVEAYLASLPGDRREAISAIREVILKNLDKDYEEGIQYGMIGYYVPHRIFPAGYHCDPKQPLPFAGIASQKNHISIYLSCLYGSPDESRFREEWQRTGRKLDMGKACVRIKRLEDVALEVLGEAIRRVPADKHIERYQAMLNSSKQSVSEKRSGNRPSTGGKPRKTAGSAASAAKNGKKKPAAKAAGKAAGKKKPVAKKSTATRTARAKARR